MASTANHPGEEVMKYLFLLYADESRTPAPDSAEMQTQQAAYGAFYEEVAGAGVMKGGDPVHGSAQARVVRSRNGSVDATSGPFSPGGEQIIGFYVLDVASEDEAVKYAAKIPAASVGAVEVRQILALA
jgi:hypothetical protein